MNWADQDGRGIRHHLPVVVESLRDATYRRALVDLGHENMSGDEVVRRSKQVDLAMAIVLITRYNIGKTIRKKL